MSTVQERKPKSFDPPQPLRGTKTPDPTPNPLNAVLRNGPGQGVPAFGEPKPETYMTPIKFEFGGNIQTEARGEQLADEILIHNGQENQPISVVFYQSLMRACGVDVGEQWDSFCNRILALQRERMGDDRIPTLHLGRAKFTVEFEAVND